MKGLWFILGNILFGFLFWNFLPQQLVKTDITKQRYASSGEFDQKISNATLQILVYPGEGDLHEHGIATLVSFARETVILTHNHWDYLQDLEMALIVNPENNLLVELSASEFKNLIRYSDRGTLILKAPAGLLGIPARLGDGHGVRVGDFLQVVQRNSVERYQLDVVLAEVITIDTYNGLPVIRFRLLNGDMIKEGDSGGGIWYKGDLIGNTWGMYVEEKSNPLTGSKMVQTSIAAQLPMYYLEFLEDSQTSSQTERIDVRVGKLEKDTP